MMDLLVSFSIALAFTMGFTLRFNRWNEPKFIFKYFIYIWTLEGITHYYFIPHGAFGIEVSLVCLFIAFALFIAGRILCSKLLKY